MPNSAPTLSGVSTSVTFAENTVNATPQIIDADVTFLDLDNNFLNGSLTLTGLLAEDRIAIRNQGTTAGLIGVSGSNVTYGGVTIGSFTGGVGNAFSVTFNAAATSAAIDALIQNLTYANVSNTPVASRDLVLDVFDAAGAHLGSPAGAANFVQQTGGANPFGGIFATTGPGGNFASFSSPTLVDYDNDGDTDLLYGDNSSGARLFLYQNNAGTFTAVTGAANPFSGIAPSEQYSPAPTFVDIDGDGDLDLVLGYYHGDLFTYRNGTNGTSGAFTDTGAGNPFAAINASGVIFDYAAPVFVDLDGDGDQDMVVGSRGAPFPGTTGPLQYFRNGTTGASGAFTQQTGAANPLAAVNVVDFSTPAFADIDGDGDQDLVVGSYNLGLQTWRNNGNGTFTQLTGAANPFNGINLGTYIAPAFGDVDGDGDMDLIVGNAAGEIRYFLNTGTPPTAGVKITINVTPESENAAPVVDLNGAAGGTGSTLAYTENDAAAALAAGATVTDSDSVNFDGGTLEVSFTNNGGSGDRLTILNQGTGAGQISVSGNVVSYQGVQIGTFGGGTNGATPLGVTFDPDATPAAVQALIRAIAYSSVSDALSTYAIIVKFVVTDGDGGTSSEVFAEIDITGVNDAPVLDASRSPALVAMSEDPGAPVGAVGTPVSALVDSTTPAGGLDNVTDPDAGAQLGIAITGIAAAGTLYYSTNGGASWTAVGAVSDASALLLGTDANTRIFYQPAQDANGTIANVITFRAWDQSTGTAGTLANTTVNGGSTAFSSATDTASINVTAVNDVPVLTGLDATPTYTENGAAVVLDANATVVDPELAANGNYNGATLVVERTGGANGADAFSFAGIVSFVGAPGDGTLLSTASGFLQSIATATRDNGRLVVTFNASASQADVNAVLQQLTYANGSDAPPPTVTLSYTFTDGNSGGLQGTGGVGTATGTITVNIVAVNDAPVLDPSHTPVLNTVNEDAGLPVGAVGTLVSNLVDFATPAGQVDNVTDPDGSGASLGIAITGTNLLGGTLYYSVNGGASWTQVGSVSDGSALLLAADAGTRLYYVPAQDYNGSIDGLITFRAWDQTSGTAGTLADTTNNGGTTAFSTAADVANLTVNAVNDAPSGTDASFLINEDATYVFTAASFGFSDPVEGDGFTGVIITTVPVPGTLFYDADGVGGAAGTPFNPGGFILISEIALGHLYFTPVANGSGTPFASFTFQVQDNAGTANGGQDTDQSPNTITFNVTAVNDAPINGLPLPQTINEDGNFTLSTGNGNALSVSDVDATTLTVTLSVAHGTLTLASLAGLSFGAGDGTADATMTFSGTQAAINAALGSGLTYNPIANYNGADAISVTTTDGGQTGTGPVGTDSDTVAINVNSVNDAPSGADNTLTGSEDDPLVFTAADFGFADPVEGNAFFAVRIMSFPVNGTLFLDVDGPGGAAPVNLSSVGVGVYVGIADINAGRLYFQPDADEYGDGYASFTFQVQDDGGIANGGVDLDPTANTITIDIEPDNLAPVVDLNGAGGGINYATTFVEDGAAVAIGSGVLVSDPDSGLGDLIESATITLTDRVAGDSLVFSSPVPGGFSVITTNAAGSITIEITGTGTGAQYQAMIESIVYATTNQDPSVGGTDLARTINVTVNDGTISSLVATTTVNITAVDDLPVAQPDAFTITESGTITGGNLFANNGAGADSDPDGPPLSVSAVNGAGGNVGTQIVLASGALLTVNANGTFDYNPNGVFLPTPTAGSGASNTPSHDSFTYTVAGGNSVTVTITLTGLDTDDILHGTGGPDILSGGLGNDTYYVENSTDQVIELAAGGNDRIITSVSYALGATTDVETLEAAAGTAALNLIGNALANKIVGNDGANYIDGGGGLDVLVGGGGDDVYVVDGASDVVTEAAGGGSDTIYTSSSYQLGAGQSVETLAARDNSLTVALNLIGNELANALLGNNGANYLDGGAGADVLVGYGGNDVYAVDSAADQVFEGATGGSDTIYTSSSYQLGAGQSVEVLAARDNSATTALNLVGNELANTLLGNNGANFLDGGAGTDILAGYGGNDVYAVDNVADLVFEDNGGGNDSVYASVSYTLGAGQSVELLAARDNSATVALNFTGNEIANTILGNNGANILDGKGGNDVLVGYGGADIFAFTTAPGAGNVDTILDFTHGTDKIGLDDAVFTAIGGLGALNASAFVTGGAALDANDRIIYNATTGQLFYDADGNGAGAAVQFAMLSPGLSLTASDFQVI
jgi:Ca2+-binding RTX toxin-like protein